MREKEKTFRYIAIIVSGLSVSVGISFAVRAAECPPSAVVEGDPSLSAPIRERLAASGVRSDYVPDCPVVNAFVFGEKELLSVRIEDTSGRVSQRTVSSIETAATLIESWTRNDLSSPFLEPRVADGAPSDEAVAATEPPPDAPDEVAKQEEQSFPEEAGIPLRMLLAGEATVSWDSGTWVGGRVGLGFGLGRIIVGGVFRFSIDTELSGPASSDKTHRTAFDGLVFFDVPIEQSRLILTPGVDIGGGGVTRWRRIESSLETGDEIHIQDGSGGVRLGGHLTMEIPLRWGFGFMMDISFIVSLPIDEQLVTEDGYSLAGEPRGYTRIGFGVRYDYPLGGRRRGK